MKRSKGFTLIELLVVVAIIALLVSILLPTLGRARELAKQAICGSNLKSIGTAWALYNNEANDNPPILPDLPSAGSDWTVALKLGTLAASTGPTGAVLGFGAQQNLCLLVNKSAVNWNHFLCPSVGTSPPNRAGQYGMGDTALNKSYCDYGIQLPYKSNGSATNAAALGPNMNGSMVIMADRGPITTLADTQTKWSPNHPDDGENALNAGFSAKFVKEKNTLGSVTNCFNTGGYDMNNIYTTDTWAAGPKLSAYAAANGPQTDTTNGMYDSIIYSWK